MYKHILALTGIASEWCATFNDMVEKDAPLPAAALSAAETTYLMMRTIAADLLAVIPDSEEDLRAQDLLLTTQCVTESGWTARFERVAWEFLRFFSDIGAPTDTERLLRVMSDLTVFIAALHHCALHIPSAMESLAKSA